VFTLAVKQADAGEMKRRFQEALKRQRRLCVDAGAVAGLSTADVQVLLSAAALAQTRELPFRVVAASSPFVEAFEQLGLRAALDAWRGDLGSSASSGRDD